ncbi:hypothetical protein EV193_10329 [Herbihabitans rhizosphaerae]|uniref:Uncharacterized protein n=1 Tax=Herbihabitans rhizosphaerae TaxID=1872711 RepID=A0A4Q7KUP1_9PSEU|nr:hypothetical protein [Herbihabitans rhizosphaerae]RZS40718.1 hypothetical protein EV193_10329 [Herbihabitans rhizosphaerae]
MTTSLDIAEVGTVDGAFAVSSDTLYVDGGGPDGWIDLVPIGESAEPRRISTTGAESRFRLTTHDATQVRLTDLDIPAHHPDFPLPAIADDEPVDVQARSAAAVAGLTDAITAAAPEGWSRLRVEVAATITRMEITARVELADGESAWVPPAMVSQWLHRLRLVSYTPALGAWSTAVVELAAGEQPVIEYDYLAEPPFRVPAESVAGQHFYDDLRLLPRTPEATPGWLIAGAWRYQQARLTAPADPPRGTWRSPLLDGFDAAGKPFVYRTALTTHERDLVLRYLREAPVVLASHRLVEDYFAGDEPVVPTVFHSDGTLVWSAATAYYLDKYGIAPSVRVLDHIRARGHRAPAELTVMAAQRASANVWESDGPERVDLDQGDAGAEVVEFGRAHHVDPRKVAFYEVVDQAWCLVREGDEYVVFYYRAEGEQRIAEQRFRGAKAAAAYVIGQLYVNLDNVRGRQ